MAVSIDTVYQKVLAIANKEQRGYITPQEFNLFADQAQMDIFEQYFYDENQFIRIHGNSTTYADMVKNLEEKISIFERYDTRFVAANDYGDVVLDTLEDLYRLGMVRVDYDSEPSFTLAENIQLKELMTYADSPLTKPTKKRPLYVRYPAKTGSTGKFDRERIKVYPYPKPPTERVLVSYIAKPRKAVWGYVVVGENALYEESSSDNFELHVSEENNLVMKILSLAGIAIKDATVYQAASAEETKSIQQQKQ
tara:strand:- start:1010 stop:1765 length:756 start_codon:yes stop_codon:yes gene_type:complete